MTILQTLGQIPPMLYASMILLPVALFVYLIFSAPKKAISASAADPADQLKEKKVDVRREVLSGIFLAATVAFGAAVLILIGGVISDYKNNQGLFAVALPPATFPPPPNLIVPPAPKTDDQGGIVGKNNVVETTEKPKEGIIQ